MKLTIMWTFAATLAMALLQSSGPTSTVLVSASQFAPMYTFNNGNVESDKTCSASEWTSIQASMTTALQRRRLRVHRALRLGHHTERILQLRRARCDFCEGMRLCLNMAGMGCGKLHGSGRRQLNVNSNSTAQCPSEVTAVEKAFSHLKPSLSASCQRLMNAPKRISCQEFYVDCAILGFTVTRQPRNSGQSIVTTLDNGGTTKICAAARDQVWIEALADFHMGEATMEVQGPQGFSMTNNRKRIPYHVEGKLFSVGSEFRPGTYTVKAYSLDDPESGKTVTFNVQAC